MNSLRVSMEAPVARLANAAFLGQDLRIELKRATVWSFDELRDLPYRIADELGDRGA